MEGYVNFQDTEHQLHHYEIKKTFFIIIVIMDFHEIFIKLRCFFNPLKRN